MYYNSKFLYGVGRSYAKSLLLRKINQIDTASRCYLSKNTLCLSSLNESVDSDVKADIARVDADLKKRIFNTFLWENDPTLPFVVRKSIENKKKREYFEKMLAGEGRTSRPLTLKLLDDPVQKIENETEKPVIADEMEPQYPYSIENSLSDNQLANSSINDNSRKRPNRRRQELERKKKRVSLWMSDYEFYDEKSLDGRNSYFGTSDPNEPVSKIPCGGCGALLHCQDHSIPGYLPKELFGKRKVTDLKSMICQRCHFLKKFNIALDVNVTPEDYPKIISRIKNERAIAVLLVDLLDFPCSIWPEIMGIIGEKRPVIVVGNKVDLIPGDHDGYLKHIKNTLQAYVEKMGIAKANIKHVALISAQTGFGVEDLITQMHQLWEYKSDVYLIGCTNVGKSSLFNQLLQSDFCKTLAIDVVQRATTSIWPGTTLNLLKFPILRPEGWRLAERKKRLSSEASLQKQERSLQKEQLKRNRMYNLPSLIQHVGRTFIKHDMENRALPLDVRKAQYNENSKDFVAGRWCFDTPGVMHPDQILNILTTEELQKTLPKTPIVPRFFILKPGRSVFLAGLGRIDLLSATNDNSARIVVFSSSALPVSIVQTHEAEDVYTKFLGSELMAVPCGGSKRLADWPGLQASDELINIKGSGWKESCADIVLSSAGWVSISAAEYMEMCFKVWTPYARGIHLRQPSLLPFAINFRGKRIDHTPTYHNKRADGSSKNGTQPFEVFPCLVHEVI